MTDATDRPKGETLGPLRALVPYVMPYKGTLYLAMAALLLASAAQLGLPVAIRFLIDGGMMADDVSTIDQYFLGLFGVAMAFGIFSAFRFYLVTWLGERVVADIRKAVYAHVIRLDPTFFEVTKTGEVLSRLTTDTTLIQSISGTGLSITLRASLNLIGASIMLAVTSPRLMGMILLLVPLVIVPIILVGRRVRSLSKASQDRIADTSGLAGETLNAISTVQAFTLEKLQSDRFADAVKVAFQTAVQRIRVRSLLTGIAILFIFGAITFVLWIGTHSVMRGEMTGGQLGQFLLYAIFVATSAAALSEMWGEVQRAAGAMERLVELLDSKPAIVAPTEPATLPEPSEGRIRLDNISFRYPSRPETLAISDFDLQVESGETLAIVGPSGAGKSTLFQLLLRFYDPESGHIEIDGVDISQAAPEAVRARIGLVPQETVIFGTTAKENIGYGRPGASDAEIAAAAEAAAADVFIEQLPEGFDTFLGERGTRLSGGQRQRIAIARAILKDPPILLLDEATSSLDAESERVVQEALEHLMRDRTTIIIAHRLATVLKANRIVVMDHGRIVDIGTHEQLVQRDSLYAHLAELQFGEGGLVT
ncbi:MAG: ABC transporter transmembrane domain-containing protein [Woeseiaceae bacterium]|nr:ABC transporter transmembrane domain-containing protein [Woeseiaceae bacterium]MDX2608608.1 ABC transporter transmembrane domain-containing protein [Woeseiaceae bacterium]